MRPQLQDSIIESLYRICITDKHDALKFIFAPDEIYVSHRKKSADSWINGIYLAISVIDSKYMNMTFISAFL